MSDSKASPYDPRNLSDVSGLVAVVTGGGTGIGLIIAKTLESQGAKVFITGRRQEKLDAVAKQAVYGNIIPLQGDVTSHEDLQRAVDAVTKQVGYIDLLVCNAGMTTFDSSLDARPKPTGESSIQEIRDYYFNYRPQEVWQKCLDTNVAAVFLATMAFLELLDNGNKRRDPAAPTSQVIATGSVGGLVKFTDSFMYNASKAGVHQLMKNLGNFLVPHDIRTNVIAPGWFASEMTAGVVKAWEHSNGVMPRTLVPRQRMGNEEELAGTILYLASKAGGYCNGHVMVIDGGVAANHP